MTTTERPAVSHTRANLALIVLGCGAFVTGTAELIVVGILNLVAHSMSTSISTTGLIVTGYALGMAIGGPLVTAATIRLPRRLLLMLALAVWVVGNALVVVSVNFGMLFAARVLTGVAHGLFMGVASAIAAALVAPEMRGRAMAIVIGGLAVSTVLGVPLGTLVGQALGWQAAFIGVGVLGLVVLGASAVLIPHVAHQGSTALRAQAKYAFAPRVLAVLFTGLLIICAMFTVFTYLTPYLNGVTHISGGMVSVFLLTYGVAGAVGTLFIGGRLADRNAALTIAGGNVIVVIALGVLYLLGASPIVMILSIIPWGLVGFGFVPAFQSRNITLAGPGGDLAATLGVSAVNIGIAAGAGIGSWVVASSGIHAVALAGWIIAVIALPASWSCQLLKVPAKFKHLMHEHAHQPPTVVGQQRVPTN